MIRDARFVPEASSPENLVTKWFADLSAAAEPARLATAAEIWGGINILVIMDVQYHDLARTLGHRLFGETGLSYNRAKKEFPELHAIGADKVYRMWSSLDTHGHNV